MQIMPNESSESGYQSRPAAPPSAGRALSVLVAVCAVLWVWLMLPRWWQIDAAYQCTFIYIYTHTYPCTIAMYQLVRTL